MTRMHTANKALILQCNGPEAVLIIVILVFVSVVHHANDAIVVAFSPTTTSNGAAGAGVAASGSRRGVNVVDINESTPRNIKGLQQLIADTKQVEGNNSENVSHHQFYQITTCPGWKLVTDPVDEQDWSVSTTKPLSPNDIVIKVPSTFLLSSTQIQLQSQHQQEALVEAEQKLVNDGYIDDLPLFRLFVVLLQQYELGEQSAYYQWIDSLPRRFYNGVVMTSACFECLPPYVRYLSEQERDTCHAFQSALAVCHSLHGESILAEPTAQNSDLLKWAYCVVVTRSIEVNNVPGGGDSSSPTSTIRIIAPMADMFNHGSFDNDVQMTFDNDWNCIVYATRHVSAGSNLRLCYGDPTNPSLFFARYGFLDKSSPASFCKLLHLRTEMTELQMDFSSLLFYKDTGDISEGVWDLLLYSTLKQIGGDRQEELQGFYDAYLSGDVDTKNMYHQRYLEYTSQALRDHVDGVLSELDDLSALSKTYDIAKHPRLSLIMQHNNFVHGTFARVKANLDTM